MLGRGGGFFFFFSFISLGLLPPLEFFTDIPTKALGPVQDIVNHTTSRRSNAHTLRSVKAFLGTGAAEESRADRQEKTEALRLYAHTYGPPDHRAEQINRVGFGWAKRNFITCRRLFSEEEVECELLPC